MVNHIDNSIEPWTIFCIKCTPFSTIDTHSSLHPPITIQETSQILLLHFLHAPRVRVHSFPLQIGRALSSKYLHIVLCKNRTLSSLIHNWNCNFKSQHSYSFYIKKIWKIKNRIYYLCLENFIGKQVWFNQNSLNGFQWKSSRSNELNEWNRVVCFHKTNQFRTFPYNFMDEKVFQLIRWPYN